MTNLDYMKLPQNNNPPKLRNVKNQVQLGGMMENCNPDMGCVCRRITSGRQKGRKRKTRSGESQFSGTFRDQTLLLWQQAPRRRRWVNLFFTLWFWMSPPEQWRRPSLAPGKLGGLLGWNSSFVLNSWQISVDTFSPFQPVGEGKWLVLLFLWPPSSPLCGDNVIFLITPDWPAS